MKRYAVILFSLALAGCDRYGPLVKVERPDTAHAYRANTKAVITDQATLDRLVGFFGAPGRSWHRYWVTTPSPEVTATLEKDGKPVASVIIGPDWVIASLIGDLSASYSMRLTPEEHDELLRLLGVSEKTPNQVPEPTSGLAPGRGSS